MKKDCVFCKIINKEIPTVFIHQEDNIFVFEDINPKAPVHFLIVPREHINSILDLHSNQSPLLTKLIKVVQTIVKEHKLEGSFRIMVNGGKNQEIPHLHIHLLAD